MRKTAVLLLLSTMPSAAFAAQPQPDMSGGCYEIVSTFRTDAGLILLNRCNGSTWMLTRDPQLGADRKPNGSSTFSWHPIETVKEPPVLFDALRLPALPRPNASNTPNAGTTPPAGKPAE